MHSALIVVEKPEQLIQIDERQRWLGFEAQFRGIVHRYKGIDRLSENACLIPLKTALPALAEVLDAATSQKIPYRILFFEKDPDWVRSTAIPDLPPAGTSKGTL